MFADLFGDLQKRTGRYLLQRYLGQFLDGKLSLEQLNINLLNGRGTVNNVSLCCKSVNELCEEQGWGVEVTGGHIGQVTVTVPWNALLIDDSSIEVTNLQISLKPKPRETDGASMLESMWSSVSSSMQLAKECLENEGNGADVAQLNAQNPIDGLEKFAQTIENILKRVKAKFLNTEIRLEYIPPNSNKGIAIIIKIDYLNYQNEACNDPAEDPEGDDQDDNLYSSGDESTADRNNKSRGQKTHFISSHSTHHITIEGITISTEEFKMEKKHKGSATVTADDEHETLSVSSANTSSGIDNTSATSLISSTQFYSVIMTDLPNEKKDQNSYSSGLEDNDDEDDEVTVEDVENENEDTEHEEDRDEGGDEDIVDDDESDRRISNKIIPIIRIDGTQEVRIKVKEIDNISGPKVALDLQIGAVFIFLSPRQIHLLTHFYDAYFNDTPPKTAQPHPMDSMESSDKILIGGVGVGGWSDPLENFTTRADPFNSHRTINNQHQRHRPYCESLSDSITSTSTTTTTNSSRFHRKAANLDMNGDISSFSVRVASVYSVVLHEEVLFESCGRRPQPPLTEESVTNLLDISNYFFSCIEGNSVNNFKCERNYVRAQVKPIVVDGIQQRNNNNIYMKFKIFLTKCDLYEHLNGGRQIVPIIMFDRTENMAGGFLKRPELTLVFKSSTPATIYSSSSRRKISQPKTELRILLETCTLELDISIYDRLSAIFTPSPFPQSAQTVCVLPNNKYPQPLVELTVEAPIFNINLRFPIADCRPLHDPNRVPWWKQNIQPDFFQIVFYQFRLSVISTVIEILGNELDFFYCESESSPKIHIGKANLTNCTNGSGAAIQEDVDYPKITLEFPSASNLESNIQFIQDGSDSGETSGEGCELYKHKSKISLPFCSKRVCRESDTPHVKRGIDETETVLLPGDKAELNKFCDRTMKTSKMQIKLHLPVVSFQIPSKHLYETIYNRLNTDLLMWEPSSPIAQSNLKTPTSIPNDQNLYNIGMMDSMYVPPPMNSTQIDNDIFGGHNRDDDNNSGQSDCESDSLYYSTYDRKRSRKSQKEPANSILSSLCSFELTVSKGMLDFSTPVRDSENRVLPGQCGEFIILADNLKLFSVNGFNGNENLAYLCVQAKNAEIYHCGLLPFKEESNRTLRSFDSPIPHYMKSTIYSTPKDLTKGEFVNENSRREMISVVIEIKKNLEQRIKRMKLTIGVQKTALRYHPTLSQHSWLTQIMDFVDVVDYPIEGYKPFGIITEMQLHLWDCAIDYRPKFLAFRAVLEIGCLLLSSNIISSVTGCTLRFVPEECVLSLAPYDIIKRQQNDNVVSALPSKDLIPVIDIGLFDISLRINDKATESFPKLDLRASIHDIHIRTCSDSGRALAQLISYFASDGDYGGMSDKSEIGDEDSSMTTSHTSSIYCEADLLSMKECATSNPEISPEQQERVNQMVADAVQETVRSPSAYEEFNELKYDERGVEVFYFPDETHQFPCDRKLRDISPSSMSTSPSRNTTPQKLQHRSTSDEWGFRTRRESESSNELRDLLNFEENVMKRSYMVDHEDNIGEDDEVIEALPQIREELGEIVHHQKVRFHSDLDDDYCVIGDEERIAMSQCGIKDVKLSEDPLRIVDNHFTPPLGKPDLLRAPEQFPMAVMRYTLCEMTVVWHLYGGHDFDDADSERDKENIKPKAHMSEAYKHGVSFSKNQNSVTFGKKPMEKVSWKTKGGKNRNHDVLIEIQLTKVKLSHEEYPITTTQASRQVLIISEMEIRDRLQSSEINKFLHHPTGNFLPNKSSKHMVVIKALHVRPFPHRSQTQECSLRVSLLPMRINIDQDTLLFFVQFFTELTETGNADFAEKRSSSTSSLQAPIMMVDDLPESLQDLQARKLVNKNIDLLMDDESLTSASVVFGPKEDKKDDDKGGDDSMSSISSSASDASPIYFKEVVFSPEVLIRLDYVGRRIEMSRGPVAGLLMGLGQLQCSEIRLKQICHRHGVLGFDKLFSFLFKEWLADIKKNQLPAILRGVGPTYTIVQLFQGIRDLFWLPIEQYQKDGRIVRGLQLGAQSFTARTAFAALEITQRIIQLLQLTAETAFDMVSPGPSSVRSRRHKKNKKKRLHRPQDIRQGFGNAYMIVKDGINERVNTVIENTIVEHDQKGYTGAAGAIIRQIPPIALAPVVLATQATTNILGGVKNQLVPDAKYEAREKWKDDSD